MENVAEGRVMVLDFSRSDIKIVFYFSFCFL